MHCPNPTEPELLLPTYSIFGNDGDDVLFGDSRTNVVFGGGGALMFDGKGDDRLLGCQIIAFLM